MRYYCDSSHSLNHTSGSVTLLERFLLADISPGSRKRILDLGCGNGRNSLYLAKMYPNSDITLVDKDPSMLEWAKEQFMMQHLPDVKILHLPIEELAANPSNYLADNFAYDKANGEVQKFDIIIFSYVVQHIDPAYYPLVFDFCRRICNGYFLVDAFWNPSRVKEGERISFDDVDWYGISYEELVTLVAPRFSLQYDRVVHNDISIVINLALTPGETPLETVLSRQYEYYTDRISRRRGKMEFNKAARISRPIPPFFTLEEIPCVKLLESLYPDKLGFIKSELGQWIQSSGRRVPISILAARFLLLCRGSKVPLTLNELCEGFGIPRRVILKVLLSADIYLPALTPTEYIGRICRQLQLPRFIEDKAKQLVRDGDDLDGGSPVVRACCAIHKFARKEGLSTSIELLAKVAGVTPTAIRNSIKRTEVATPA